MHVYDPSNYNFSLFLILEYRKTILLRIIWIDSITVSSFVNFKRLHTYLYCSLARKYCHN